VEVLGKDEDLSDSKEPPSKEINDEEINKKR
jgi:hypothetical protein